MQSSGLAINLVTKSGSNVFKGSAVGTFENDSMQAQNVTKEMFDLGANGFLSGTRSRRIAVYSAEYGGPIMKNRLWFWAAADKQDINTGVVNFFDSTQGQFCQICRSAEDRSLRSRPGDLRQAEGLQKCLNNDKTDDQESPVEDQLPVELGEQIPVPRSRATTSTVTPRRHGDDAEGSDHAADERQAVGAAAADALDPAHADCLRQAGVQQPCSPTCTAGSSSITRMCRRRAVASRAATRLRRRQLRGAATSTCLWNIQSLTNRTTGFDSRSLTSTYQTTRHSWEAKSDGTYFLTNMLGGDHSLKFGVGWRRNPIQTFSHYSGGARAHHQCVGNNAANCGDGTTSPRIGGRHRAVPGGSLPRSAAEQRLVELQRLLQDGFSRAAGASTAGCGTTGRLRTISAAACRRT